MKKKSDKIPKHDKVINELNTLRKSVLNLKFQKTSGQLEKTSEIKKAKKKIANLLTQMNKHKESQSA